MDTNKIRQEVEMTYEKVKSLAGWTVDKNVVLTITSFYISSGREFDAISFNKSLDEIKRKSGWFSPLRGNLLPVMGALLDKPNNNIEEELDRLFEKQQVLKKVGFRNTIHSYLAALLMSNEPELTEIEARQAKNLYDEMKKQHFFLTSDDDYAYAVLLSKRKANPVNHAYSMRTYYDALRKEGFRSGNELQWMSQLLTYLDETFDPQLVSRVAELFARLKQEAKVRPVHYPMIGFLAVFGTGSNELMNIIELTRSLEQSKLFRWNKEMALSLAIGYVMQESTEIVDGESSIILASSIELILQAQQAVMAATTAAIVASSVSSSSSST